MKKWIFIIILFMVVGWTVVDFVVKDNESKEEATETLAKKGELQKTKNIQDGKQIHKEVDSNQDVGLNIGNLAPDFELNTLKNEKRRLSELRGEPVMINFWASWCPPCKAEMPDMEKFYKNKGMEIASVNLTREEKSDDKVKGFVKDFKLTFPIMLDKDGEVAETYKIKTIPETYILDEDGRIFYKAVGPMNYDFMVAKLAEVKRNDK